MVQILSTSSRSSVPIRAHFGIWGYLRGKTLIIELRFFFIIFFSSFLFFILPLLHRLLFFLIKQAHLDLGILGINIMIDYGVEIVDDNNLYYNSDNSHLFRCIYDVWRALERETITFG